MPLAKGAAVWVKDPALKDEAVFFKGTVVSDDGKQVTVKKDEDGSTAAWKNDKDNSNAVLLATTNTEDVKDHTMLDVLNEATLLENTKKRFMTDKIQAYISEILIITNPFKRIPGIYDEEVMKQYKGANWTKLEPHVFATSEMAYNHMVINAQSQSLLVAGESGAGKTETNKQLLNYLIWRAGSVGAGTSTLSQDILDTNPVLEAFGNAKTIRNNNSSRFGKYLNIKFNSKYQIMGAEVRTFLLEKSRVTSSSGAGERSYHIYYQVLAGANMAEMGDIGVPELKGKKAEGFHYTNQSGTVRSEAIDDDKEFKDMHHGLKSCGLSDEDRVSTYQVVSSVLSIGEVSFEPDGDGAAIAPATKAHLAKACELLGIEDVSVDLVEKVTKVGVEEFHIKLTMEAAAKQKDALAKHIFNLLFDLLVGNMNLKIDTDKHMHKFIGLLDVFGFEVFQSNSFEQLCINYANERLHNFFLMRVFEVEIELYRMQNLNVPKLDYPDNAKVIELLEKKPAGIFPCLDGQCKMPKATDLTFAASLHKSHKEQPHFSTLSKAHLKGVNLRDEETFVVRHFAADVCYTAAGFLEKNSDALSPEFEKKLTNSSKSLVKQLIQGVVPKAAAEGGVMLTSRGSKVPMSARRKSTKGGFDGGKDGKDGKGGQPAQSSVGAKFLKGLSQLMREIATTHPYFVRCIKPNQVLKPLVFNSAMILRQLQCSGTIECVKLMQAGYPNRAPYADLHSRFQKALPDKMSNLEPKEFVKVLLAATGCQDGDYQMGQDMVFFKGSKGAVLQELMLTPKEELASKILEKLKVSDPKNAQIKVLEEYIEFRKKQRAAAFSRLVNGVQGVCAMFDWIGAWELAKRKRNEAAAKMQAHARGKHARKQVHEMKESGKKIEIAEAPVVAEPDLEVVFDLNAELKKMEDEKAKEPEDEAAAEAAEHEAKWFVSADNCPHADMKGSSKKYHRFLMCKGVEWGFQYHNFYGDWEFDDEQPLCNGRPHYKHNTMYGGYAHLFHCIDPHYHVPRWVIGPSPGNENGWAFCESDAPTPWENTACWISWDGFEWHTCKNFRFVPKEHELDGLSDEDQFDEEAELEVYYAEQQKQQEEEDARAAAKAAAAKPESKPAESKPAVEAKQVKAEPEPKPGAKEDKKKKGDKKKDEKKKEKKGGLFGKKK